MATAADIEYIRRITPDAVHDQYTEEQLGDLIDEHGVRGVARRFWEERVAQTAGFIDVKEGSSTRELSQEHDHAKEMLALYGGPIDDGELLPEGALRPARVHRIRREAVDEDV